MIIKIIISLTLTLRESGKQVAEKIKHSGRNTTEHAKCRKKER